MRLLDAPAGFRPASAALRKFLEEARGGGGREVRGQLKLRISHVSEELSVFLTASRDGGG
eukprot:3433995-Pyramimonas_sp.AAC.2